GCVAGGQLARARSVRHVRCELHRTSRSPADSDAGRLAGTPAAEGLPARRPWRVVDGKSNRLAEAPPGKRRSGYRVGGLKIVGRPFQARATQYRRAVLSGPPQRGPKRPALHVRNEGEQEHEYTDS